MQYVIDNWYLIVAMLAVVAFVIFSIVYFSKVPNDEQLTALKEWLKWAVTLAEQKLGSGTGQLKLRYVYDLALTKFPWIASVFTFKDFEGYVDEALVWMREQLSKNERIMEVVNNDK